MNCLEFRRRIATEPRSRGPDLDVHRSECESCASFASEQMRFDDLLSESMALPAPAGLEKRLLLRQRLERARIGRRRLMASLALAAAVLIGVLALTMAEPSTDELVFQHVRSEWDHGLGSPPVDRSHLEEMLAASGIVMAPTNDPVVYAGSCGFGDGTTTHLVLSTPFGPVTVLIMPNEQVARRRTTMRGDLHGVLLPLGTGGLAVVGQASDGVARVEAFVRTGLRTGPG